MGLIDKIAWYIARKCICYIDRNDDNMTMEFNRDSQTTYHIDVERRYDNCYFYGTHYMPYPNGVDKVDKTSRKKL